MEEKNAYTNWEPLHNLKHLLWNIALLGHWMFSSGDVFISLGENLSWRGTQGYTLSCKRCLICSLQNVQIDKKWNVVPSGNKFCDHPWQGPQEQGVGLVVWQTNMDSESLRKIPWGCGFMKIFLCYCLEALTGQSLLKYARHLSQHEHENWSNTCIWAQIEVPRLLSWSISVKDKTPLIRHHWRSPHCCCH